MSHTQLAGDSSRLLLLPGWVVVVVCWATAGTAAGRQPEQQYGRCCFHAWPGVWTAWTRLEM